MIISYPSYSLRRERDLSSWLLGPLLVLQQLGHEDGVYGMRVGNSSV